jgi:HNH endonuclease
MNTSSLTQNYLREVLRYEPDTGNFFWLKRAQGRSTKNGGLAGGLNDRGYKRIKLGENFHYAHRLVWLYVHGEWPSMVIDHINGDKADNRLENLRCVSVKENNQNRRKPSRKPVNHAMGVYGVGDRFAASISVDNKNVYIGTFDTANDAHTAYLFAKRLLHAGCTI